MATPPAPAAPPTTPAVVDADELEVVCLPIITPPASLSDGVTSLLEIVADRCAHTATDALLVPSITAPLGLQPTAPLLCVACDLLEGLLLSASSPISDLVSKHSSDGVPTPEASPDSMRQLVALLSLLAANLGALERGDAPELPLPEEMLRLSRALRLLAADERIPPGVRAQAVETLLEGAVTLHPSAEARVEMVIALMGLPNPAEAMIGLARCSLLCAELANDTKADNGSGALALVLRMLRNSTLASSADAASDIAHDPAFQSGSGEARAARRALSILLHTLFAYLADGHLSTNSITLANHAVETAIAILDAPRESGVEVFDEPLLQLVLPAALASSVQLPALAVNMAGKEPGDVGDAREDVEGAAGAAEGAATASGSTSGVKARAGHGPKPGADDAATAKMVRGQLTLLVRLQRCLAAACSQHLGGTSSANAEQEPAIEWIDELGAPPLRRVRAFSFTTTVTEMRIDLPEVRAKPRSTADFLSAAFYPLYQLTSSPLAIVCAGSQF